MKQHEAVSRAMEAEGGFATLGRLYQTAIRIPDCEWKTKTPFASIRRIVQQDPKFFKIRPGLWGLQSRKKEILARLAIQEGASQARVESFNHSYFQGLIVQLGNLQDFKTFVPHQDKNKAFLSQKLADVSTLAEFEPFTYEHLLRRARTIDVTWFNSRRLPQAFFEVEHSTDIQNSLLKFLEFEDFRVEMNIVADEARRREFTEKLNYRAFTPIREFVKFTSYDKLSAYHSNLTSMVESRIALTS